MSEAPIPGYLRVAGAAMLLWGLLGLMLLRLGHQPVRWWALAIVFVVGGLGLLLGRRWGWPLALLEAIVNLAIASRWRPVAPTLSWPPSSCRSSPAAWSCGRSSHRARSRGSGQTRIRSDRPQPEGRALARLVCLTLR